MARIQGIAGAAGVAIAVGGGTATLGTAAEPHECACFHVRGGVPAG